MLHETAPAGKITKNDPANTPRARRRFEPGDYRYHHRPFPLGFFIVGLLLLVVFGAKLLICVPVLFLVACMGWCGSRSRYVQIPHKEKRKHDFDYGDDYNVTYL